MNPKDFDKALNEFWADPRVGELAEREVQKHLGRRSRWSDYMIEAITLFEVQNFGRKCPYRRDSGKKFADCRLTLDDCTPEPCPYSPYKKTWEVKLNGRT